MQRPPVNNGHKVVVFKHKAFCNYNLAEQSSISETNLYRRISSELFRLGCEGLAVGLGPSQVHLLWREDGVGEWPGVDVRRLQGEIDWEGEISWF